jgi:hypothetical protein
MSEQLNIDVEKARAIVERRKDSADPNWPMSYSEVRATLSGRPTQTLLNVLNRTEEVRGMMGLPYWYDPLLQSAARSLLKLKGRV